MVASGRAEETADAEAQESLVVTAKCSDADNQVPRNSSTFALESKSLVCNQESVG